jgi:Fe2+ or Zn2+ uptake regulation protein
VESERLDTILARVRAVGGRITTARRAIVLELLRSQHTTAEELTASIQAQHPDVHESTVYRCLNALEELGIVEHVHLGHGPAVFHLADADHQHLVCDACGAVVEVPDTVFAEVATTLLDDYGFAARPGHFAVTGTCVRCARRGRS